MIDKKHYNFARDTSGYGEEHKTKHITQLTKTNEILSEAYTLSIL